MSTAIPDANDSGEERSRYGFVYGIVCAVAQQTSCGFVSAGDEVAGLPEPVDDRRQGIGSKAARGFAATAANSWIAMTLTLASTIVMSRILHPDAFGLIAMVSVVVGAAEVIREFGLVGAIIQAPRLGRREWTSVFLLSVTIGVVGTGAVMASAPLIVGIYGEEQLFALTLALAPSVFLNSLVAPVQGFMTRELRLTQLARIDVTARFGGFVLPIVAALLGWDVWSLVVLTLAPPFIRVVLMAREGTRLLARPTFGAEVRLIVRAGLNILGSQLLHYVVRNADRFIIGRESGATTLGQYTRAHTLFLVPQQLLGQPVNIVGLPVLSALRDSGDKYRAYLRTALMFLAYVALGGYALAAGLAEPAVELVLGPQWGQAAEIFAVLSIAGVASTLAAPQGTIMVSLGKASRQFLYGLIVAPLTVLGFVVGFMLGGVNGLALGYGIVSVLLLPVGYAVAIHGSFISPADIVLPLIRPVLLAPIAFVIARVVAEFSTMAPIVTVVVGVVGGLVPYLVALMLPIYRRDFSRALVVARKMRKRT